MQEKCQRDVQDAKRRVAEEMASFLKLGAQPKVIESYVEGLKSHKSQINLRGGFGDNRSQDEKVNIPFEKLKYEN